MVSNLGGVAGVDRRGARPATEDRGVASEPPDAKSVGLGGALRRAWVGYQRRLDEALADAGFGERRFPDGRVLRICSQSTAITISRIGRELAITRQGAGKIVASLRDRGYVIVTPSQADGRKKIVTLTPRAVDYLAAQRAAARRIERQLRTELGAEGFDSLYRLLQALGADEQPRMSDYLRKATDLETPC
jgi:DNA-binding MarR family transcriptional regulator